MEQARTLNPFSRREAHDKRSLLVYRILTIASWLAVFVVSVLYSFDAPDGGKSNRTIWGQNKAHATPFSLNPFITDIYWIILFLLQIGYVYHLFDDTWATSAANVGSHFIINNLLQFGFVLLWVHGHFWPAELLLIVNFFNLLILYFRHHQTPRLIHIPVISGPLAWTFVAILWNGAAMVGAHGLAARILANLAIWSILGLGFAFLVAFKDYSMGFNLSVLTAALAVHQLGIKVVAFQWIFAFVIMSLLFLASLAVAVPAYFGKELTLTRDSDDLIDEDRERQPLLNS